MPRKRKATGRRSWGSFSVDYHTASKRWRVRPPASVDPARRAVYFSTADEARAWATTEAARRKAVSPDAQHDLSVGEWLAHWYERTAAAADWSDRTRRVYRESLWHWSRLWRTSLRGLRPGDVIGEVGRLRTEGAESRPVASGQRVVQRRPLSAIVIRNSAGVLKRALEAARDDGYVDRNVAASVPLPKADPSRRSVWTLKQRRLLVAELEQDRLYPVFVLLFTCGLRIGEALALKWSDIDWERRLLLIQRTVHKRHIQEWPKNRKPREVSLTPFAWASLLRHRDSGVLTGPVWVFTREDGGIVGYDRVRKRLQLASKRAGVPYLATHTARHAHVSELMAAGITPAEIADRIGHTGLSTLPRYTHASGREADAILEASDAILGTAEGTNGVENGVRTDKTDESTR